MRDRKGVELAMNTIIIAAISLIVLVILVVVYTGGFSKLTDKFKFWGEKTRSDCVILGDDDVRDRDGDGYVNDLTYTVKYKDDNGKDADVTCECDKHPDDDTRHMDDSDDDHKRYC